MNKKTIEKEEKREYQITSSSNLEHCKVSSTIPVIYNIDSNTQTKEKWMKK